MVIKYTFENCIGFKLFWWRVGSDLLKRLTSELDSTQSAGKLHLLIETQPFTRFAGPYGQKKPDVARAGPDGLVGYPPDSGGMIITSSAAPMGVSSPC